MSCWKLQNQIIYFLYLSGLIYKIWWQKIKNIDLLLPFTLIIEIVVLLQIFDNLKDW
jgi:hypothetical protein